MRVAIYARVSTDDRGQDPENQLRELRAWCANSGYIVSHEYVEHESGRKGADRRKQFAALFDDAAKRKFDCVLFWALDRFSREGMAQTIAHLQCLVSYGVAQLYRASLSDGQRTRAKHPPRVAFVFGEIGDAEDQRPYQGRYGPRKGQRHQDRASKARD